jgi:hypothetical protein
MSATKSLATMARVACCSSRSKLFSAIVRSRPSASRQMLSTHMKRNLRDLAAKNCWIMRGPCLCVLAVLMRQAGLLITTCPPIAR